MFSFFSAISKLYRHGRCLWPSCDISFPEKRDFFR